MSEYESWSYPNRTLCSVLSAMRKCYETRNFAGLNGLIEEAQYLADRMEAALGDKNDIKKLMKKRSELKKQVRELKQQLQSKKKQTNDPD